MAKTAEEQAEERGGIIAFRASAELLERVDSVAANEGISRSDVARRELILGLRKRRGAAHG